MNVRFENNKLTGGQRSDWNIAEKFNYLYYNEKRFEISNRKICEHKLYTSMLQLGDRKFSLENVMQFKCLHQSNLSIYENNFHIFVFSQITINNNK